MGAQKVHAKAMVEAIKNGDHKKIAVLKAKTTKAKAQAKKEKAKGKDAAKQAKKDGKKDAAKKTEAQKAHEKAMVEAVKKGDHKKIAALKAKAAKAKAEAKKNKSAAKDAKAGGKDAAKKLAAEKKHEKEMLEAVKNGDHKKIAVLKAKAAKAKAQASKEKGKGKDAKAGGKDAVKQLAAQKAHEKAMVEAVKNGDHKKIAVLK